MFVKIKLKYIRKFFLTKKYYFWNVVYDSVNYVAKSPNITVQYIVSAIHEVTTGRYIPQVTFYSADGQNRKPTIKS